jgi:hypothetical protein
MFSAQCVNKLKWAVPMCGKKQSWKDHVNEQWRNELH